MPRYESHPGQDSLRTPSVREISVISRSARALIVSSNFPPVRGGAATVYENLCKYSNGAIEALSASLSYETGLAPEGLERYDASAPFSIHRIELLRPAQTGEPSKLRDLALMTKVLWRIVAVARRERIRVICLGDLVYGGWLVYPLKRLFRYPVIFYVHGEEITTRSGGGLFDRWRARFLAQADAVVCVSRFTQEALASRMGVERNKIALIENGVDTERFRPSDPDPALVARHGWAGRRVILSVGRLVRRKGFDKLIEAMPIVLKKCENAHLAIVGEGPLRDELEAAIRRHDLVGRASLLGAAADAELPALYAAAELFALPNRDMPDGDTEGFGLVFLEANACAKPVIAGRAGGAVDAVKDGVNGLLVDGESPEDIARAILRLLDDDALRSRLSAGGLAAARQADWRSRAAQFLMLCDRLAARGTGA